MNKEQRWEQRYAVPTAEGNWREKIVYPRSEAQRDANKQKIKECGYKYISCKKLYPFSTMKNQHNFELIHNIAMNELYDIFMDNKKVSDEEIDRLEAMRDRSEYFFLKELPVAWLTWDEWQEANEMAVSAIVHRQNACIENGRPDLVTYC